MYLNMIYIYRMISVPFLLGALLAALCLAGPANAQDGPVHGTVQSTSGQTVTIELDLGYRVETGIQGTIWATKITLGEETSVEQGQVRVKETDGRSVTAQITEGKGIDEGQDVQFGTVREVGTITVRVQPKDATVYMENEPVGEGTVRQVVDVGPYQLGATADGYNTEEKSVLVERGEDEVITLNLSRALGRLTVETTPSSAELAIWTDELRYDRLGRTPVRSHLYEPGTYELRISKEGYQTISDEVTLEPGALTEKSYELKQATGTLVVTSNPSGAEVYVNGSYQGTTRKEMAVEPGRHKVKLSEDGYESESQFARVSAGETENIHHELDQVVMGSTASSASETEDASESKCEYSGLTHIGVATLGALIGGASAKVPYLGVMLGGSVGSGIGYFISTDPSGCS